MKYKALKTCKFDRHYSVGEFIDKSVIDPLCLIRAVKYGFIELVNETEVTERPTEAVEGRESAPTVSVEETVTPKKRGRKKGNEAV